MGRPGAAVRSAGCRAPPRGRAVDCRHERASARRRTEGVMRTRSAAALGIALQLGAGDGGLASDLRTGMQLTYAADGLDQPAWNVDAVVPRAALKENADCARLRIRR